MSEKQKIEDLKAIDFSKDDLNKIKSFLPKNYTTVIANKLNHTISERTIKHVLCGEGPDHNNIIDTAIEIAFEEMEKRKAIAKRIKKLK